MESSLRQIEKKIDDMAVVMSGMGEKITTIDKKITVMDAKLTQLGTDMEDLTEIVGGIKTYMEEHLITKDEFESRLAKF